jgi:hypothetical protein
MPGSADILTSTRGLRVADRKNLPAHGLHPSVAEAAAENVTTGIKQLFTY